MCDFKERGDAIKKKKKKHFQGTKAIKILKLKILNSKADF